MHEFEVREEIALEATPEQVWEAIATGPGVDSWFMGHNEIEPREGGATAFSLLGEVGRGRVTAWEPNRRFAYQGDENPDGTFMAFEFLLAAQSGGTTVLRFVHNGFLGDNWEQEYDALSEGDIMYLRKLALYLKHFPGRTATFSLFLPAPAAAADRDTAWTRFADALGIEGEPAAGDPVEFTVDGVPARTGVVEFAHRPNFLAARTDDGYYLFVNAGVVVVEHHNFNPAVDEKESHEVWQGWLDRTFA